MSLATWKKEFYRTPADKVSERNALEHSIKKWIGLLPKNRKKHNVRLGRYILSDIKNNILHINGGSCALCVCYVDDCAVCPLSTVGNARTIAPCHDEYLDAIDNGKVTPMIRLLRKAKKKGLNK